MEKDIFEDVSQFILENATFRSFYHFPPYCIYFQKKRKADTDAFDKLVASYKEKISKGAKTKWFD